MDDTFFVHELKASNDLNEEHQAGLERELSTTEIEQVLERRAEQLLDHEYEVLLHDDALVVQSWEAVA